MDRSNARNRQRHRFPRDFVWGAATAAYQVEGAVAEDGRGESIWDRFTATPGQGPQRRQRRVACDSYHRYRDDIGLMRDARPRRLPLLDRLAADLPDGRGARERRAGSTSTTASSTSCSRTASSRSRRSTTGTCPQALEDRGGWTARDTAEAFARVRGVVAARLGDRVAPLDHAQRALGHRLARLRLGIHAPGRTSEADAVAAAHHVLLAHGRAVGDPAPRRPARRSASRST